MFAWNNPFLWDIAALEEVEQQPLVGKAAQGEQQVLEQQL
jgi:hypothetical protein